jgi:hypothetical protein
MRNAKGHADDHRNGCNDCHPRDEGTAQVLLLEDGSRGTFGCILFSLAICLLIHLCQNLTLVDLDAQIMPRICAADTARVAFSEGYRWFEIEHRTLDRSRRLHMAAIQETTPKKNTPPESDPTKTDRNAPAGSKSSLGAESVRNGRPSTDDEVVEAIDEETPGLAGN